MNDLVVEEVRRIRAEISERNGNDLRRIFADARSREGLGGLAAFPSGGVDAGLANSFAPEPTLAESCLPLAIQRQATGTT